MICTIFLVVRTASTRLPKKALLKIKNKSLIMTLIDRIADKNRRIIVCTTNLKTDDQLTKFLRKNKIEVFRGNNTDIINRIYDAAKKYNVEQFVVVEGDDVFCDPEIINITCKKLQNTNYEFLSWKNLPFGVSPLGIKTKKIELLLKRKINKNTETGWGYLITESGLFKSTKLEPKDKKLRRPEIRLSVDYPEDLSFARKICKHFEKPFSLLDIIKLLDKKPELLKINEKTKTKYSKNFAKKKVKLILNRNETP